uniref:Pre-mRNA-splicing factor 38 n=1 Tax=Glossina palpalis gambiensis TaxID=67801 RepID=A0A1B0B231_9MUSC
MANRTVKEAKNIHGTNPQYLVEKIIRSRIYDSKYWKEQCFALTAELLVDKAMELRFIGGVYGGNIKPTQFLCLTLKMLQIQPEKDIVVEFIKNEEFKYVRALGAFYLRLTGSALDCYKYLEPLYIDNRKLRRQNRVGHFEIVYMDEFIDELLRSDRVCDIILPRIQKRSILEENNELEPKVSVLDEDLDDEIISDEENPAEIEEESKNKTHKRSRKERSRSESAERSGYNVRSRDYNAELERYQRERERARDIPNSSSSSRHHYYEERDRTLRSHGGYERDERYIRDSKRHETRDSRSDRERERERRDRRH